MMAAALGGLGNLYYTHHQYQEAIDCYQQALDLTQKINDRRN